MNHHEMEMRSYDLLVAAVTAAVQDELESSAIIWSMAMLLVDVIHASAEPGQARYVFESLHPHQIEHLAKVELNAATPAGNA
jgi:hypothetical protein